MTIKEKLKRNKILYTFVRKIKYIWRYFMSVLCETMWFYMRYMFRKLHILKTDHFIESLKDKYKGKRIFVVATGPSLTIDTLNRLMEAGEICISCNGIFKLFDKTKWRPDYYVMDDYWLIKKYISDFPDVKIDTIGRKGTVLAEKCKGFIPYSENMQHTGYIPVCYFDHWYTHYSRFFHYNRKITLGVFDFYTVTNFAINIADYMGASEVYLLGVDCDYTSTSIHAGESDAILTEEQKKNNIEMEKGMLNGYEKLNCLIGNKIKIFNLNPSGKVDVFPRMTLEEVLSEKVNLLAIPEK